MDKLFVYLVVALGMLWQSANASDTGWLEDARHTHVKVRLERSADKALLEVQLAPGWKTYWKNPGEGGIAPTILWQDNASASWHWPTPVRFDVAGLPSQGYVGNTLFALDIATPGPVAGTLRLATCREVCVLTDFPFTLAPGDGLDANIEHKYLQAKSSLPQALPAAVSVSSAYKPGSLQLKAVKAGGWDEPDVFVNKHDGAQFGKPVLQIDGDVLLATIPVTDEWGGAAPELIGQPLTLVLANQGLGWEFDSTPDANWQAAPEGDIGLAMILLLALAGGLILNLMPCVLPVLALKVGSLTLSSQNHSSQNARELRLGFLASSGGILVSFWLLALMSTVLRLGGAALGWGIQFQSPWFIGFMLLVTGLFTANLIGLFEFRLPSNLATRLGTSGGQGRLGHFLQGVFATLLATPCSAPFLGTAVAFALAASLPTLWLVFTFLGLGMALPWLLLAFSPKAAALLPKPGPWLAYLRPVLGVLMLASSLWLVSLLVNHLALYWLLALAAGLLLMPVIALWRHAPRQGLIALFGLLLLTPVALMALRGVTGEVRTDAVVWQPLTEERINAALSEGKTVFVDVTADWCITCKVNKIAVIQDPAVQSMLMQDHVVALRGDWSVPNEAISAFLKRRGVAAIPFNQIYGPGIPDGAILSPILDSDTVLATLAKAKGDS